MIEVSAAIIFIEKKILCFQRGKGKYDYDQVQIKM